MRGIVERSDQMRDLLGKLNEIFTKSAENMSEIIKSSGNVWTAYTQAEKDEIFKAAQIAQTIKIIVDTPLLEQDGALADQSREALSTGHTYLSKLTMI